MLTRLKRWLLTLGEHRVTIFHCSLTDPLWRSPIKSTKFLGVHLAENFTWSLNTTSISKKAQQRLYFLWRLRKARLPPPILTMFYRGTIESVLSGCITGWFGNCTVSDRKTLQRIVRTAEKIIGVSLPSITDRYTTRCICKANSIVDNPTHPSHTLFTLLPSGKSGYAPQVGCELEEKERFWSELDEVIESISMGERVVIGADFNGHFGEGNTGEEVMGKFGVKERNLEGQMVMDFAKRMDMAVVNTYFQKREEHRVTYKSRGSAVLGVSPGRRKEDKETWWWNEEVQDSIQRKRLAKKKRDMDRTEEKRQEYKESQRRVKKEVSKVKQKAYDELYTRLDTREGEKDLYRLARQRDRDGKDVQQVRVIKDRDGRVLTSEESVQRRWKEYFEELMNEENEREKRVEGVNSVEQKVDKIRKDEVRKALKRMKNGKAIGPDDIPVEVWKCLGEAAVEFLISLFNRVLESERMPEEWRRSVLVPIFKNKGDVQSCSNYRGVKLMSHTMKLWERVVEARLRKGVEICEQQYGFMPRKSTTDAIFALRILMEKYRDGQRELHCVFVDLEKAYDRVPREELWYCMRKSGVAEKYVRVVQDMYERSRTVVRCAVGQTEEFKVEVGLHQGSALSPFLFAIVMDQLSEEVEENLERWRFALERRGMKVSRIQSNGECGKEVKKRVQAETVSLRKRQESELEVAELKMLRFSLGVTRLDRIRNEYIRGTAHVGRFGDKLREARLRWFGHVQRREKIREAFKVFDRDGNGFISKQELGMAMRSLGYMPNEVELEVIIQRLDMDGDGQVDFEEFVTLLGPKISAAGMPDKFNGTDFDSVFWKCDMQKLTVDELKRLLYETFCDHLTMKDIETIIMTEENHIENPEDCQVDIDSESPTQQVKQTCVRKSLICAFAIAFIISVMLIAANQVLRSGMK
ncbi:hypothetical protein QTP70_015880 [Hemibagrus guttatus]|uniref:Uncharacterized protein n=1 Tax=Hemibagrus guttatus TaxID=175788 RepID=A0AAE0UQT0_9TELE|nr:hypothetical protein QTP70_015880 [Hemibagrus guttatus]